MAQTISASRGNQAYASNSSAVTLFTNSASGSSRVIINSMAMTIIGTTGSNDMALYIRNTGGGYDIPFALYRNAVSAGMVYFLPGTVPVASWSNTTGLAGVVMYGTALDRTNDPNELRINWASSNVTSSNINVCPKSVWLGPSDSIIFRGLNSSASSSTINWNFTCILES